MKLFFIFVAFGMTFECSLFLLLYDDCREMRYFPWLFLLFLVLDSICIGVVFLGKKFHF